MIKGTLNASASAQVPFISSSTHSLHTSTVGKSPACSQAGKRILLIDDSPTIQKIVELILRREGYEIQAFHNGIEAMRWFAGPEARTPDLMLIDLNLPKLDGYHIIQKFKSKQRFAHIPYIILSQHNSALSRLKGEQVGAAAYMTKPFTTRELIAAIQSCIANQPVQVPALS